MPLERNANPSPEEICALFPTSRPLRPTAAEGGQRHHSVYQPCVYVHTHTHTHTSTSVYQSLFTPHTQKRAVAAKKDNQLLNKSTGEGGRGEGDSAMLVPPPDAAKLASDLSQCIRNNPSDAGRPGNRPPLKLLQWALGQLEECARTRSAPPSNVVEVAMDAIKDEIARPAGEQEQGPPVAPAVGAATGGGGAGNAGKGSCAEDKKPAGAGVGRVKSKGVVFTPLYGCEETATGVGPVSSILEVRGHAMTCPAGRG